VLASLDVTGVAAVYHRAALRRDEPGCGHQQGSNHKAYDQSAFVDDARTADLIRFTIFFTAIALDPHVEGTYFQSRGIPPGHTDFVPPSTVASSACSIARGGWYSS
jgi:hypothetical protein